MRLFLAVELPPVVREQLASLQAALRATCGGWRWVRAENIHLTLRFLGELDAAGDAACREAWREAAGQFRRFRVRLEEMGRFPASGRPRVLWVGVRAEPPNRLLQLAGALEEAARRRGFEPEARPYRPHLTLARAGPRPRLPDLDRVEPGPAAAVDEVVLFQSRLGPGGARYTALDRIALRD